MSAHLRQEWRGVHEHQGSVSFAGWPCMPNADLTPAENAVYAGRFNFVVTTGACSLSLDPTPAEARALAVILLTLADDAERKAVF